MSVLGLLIVTVSTAIVLGLVVATIIENIIEEQDKYWYPGI
jgi:hypothetical protein